MPIVYVCKKAAILPMMKKNVESPDIPINLVRDKADQKPVSRITYLITQSLAIIAVFMPLIWYVVYLRGIYPDDTNLLAIDALHLIGAICLLISPLLVLHLLGIKWRRPSNKDGSTLTD